MTVIWTSDGMYHSVRYQREADLERAATVLQNELFGPMGVYLTKKRKIGSRENGTQSIPDAFLIDFNGKRPRLYIVETELHVHPHFEHIIKQVIGFKTSLRSDRHGVVKLLSEIIGKRTVASRRCKAYIKLHQIQDIHELLNIIVHDIEPAILVIIDEMSPDLQRNLQVDLVMDVHIMVLRSYENSEREALYEFDPLYAVDDSWGDPIVPDASSRERSVSGDADTVIFNIDDEERRRVFLYEHRSPPIAVSEARRRRIKWAAAYQTNPQPGVTHVARVANVEQCAESTKQVFGFSKPAKRIRPKKRLQGSKEKAPIGVRYASFKGLMAAKTYDDIWHLPEADSAGQ